MFDAWNQTGPLPGGPARIGADLLRMDPPLYDAVIEEVDGRRIRVGDQWLVDFASCNYLGLDLEPEIIEAAYAATRRWGTHPSWSRLLGNPRLYLDIEEQLTDLLGAPDTLLLPTITHIHGSVLPILARGGLVLLDGRAHKTLFDGCRAAAAEGATVQRYPADDLEALERRLRDAPAGLPRMIVTDGVNSMTGNLPDLVRLADLARRFDALLYVDDAHGFGVIGERSADEPCAYGWRGNSLVRHLGESYDNIVLVGGFSKAYSALLAFVALPTGLKEQLKVQAAPYLYSGPSPTASLAGVLAGFDVNRRRGDQLRTHLHALSGDVLRTIDELGIRTLNRSGFPIMEIPVAEPSALAGIGQFLFRRGVYVTLAAYPLVPRSEVGFRIQLTAAHTSDDIAVLRAALTDLTAQSVFQPAA